MHCQPLLGSLPVLSGGCNEVSTLTICIDGSNDTGIEKMNPITIRYFSTDKGDVVTHFLDMCITTGRHHVYLIVGSYQT